MTCHTRVIQICRISRPIYSGIRKYRSRPLAWTLHVTFPPPQPNSQIITSALYIPSGSNKSLRVSSEPYDEFRCLDVFLYNAGQNSTGIERSRDREVTSRSQVCHRQGERVHESGKERRSVGMFAFNLRLHEAPPM